MTGRTHANDAAAALGPGGWMPGWMARLIGRYRQMSGRYDMHTAACYEQAWRRSDSLPSLVEWQRFRRELGLAPDAVLADDLRQALGDRRDATAVNALELLHELSATGDACGHAPFKWLRTHAECSPPIADLLERNGAPLTPRARQLAALYASQEDWRSTLAADLSSAGRVCVVGNAGSMNGARLGRQIDLQPRVVRFNRWAGPASSPRDLGSRLDVWVCAPRFLTQLARLPRDLPPWVILTGPDARYARAGRPVEWDLVLGMLDAGVKVLTLPLAAWGESVRLIGAPPSAGLLFLAWARRTLGGFERLVIAGFDIASVGTKGYHHAGPGLRSGRRHAWDREKGLLDEWKKAGLRSLSRADDAA